jgi:RNA polymerase sigma-70 factor (ECF subfamily)
MRMKTHTKANSKALDRQALVEIYEQYSPKLFRYAYRLLGDQDTAEECVAETFSRFLNSLKGDPAGPENVQAYLYRIAHNWITDYYRRQPLPAAPLMDNIQEDNHNRRNGNPAVLLGEQMEIERVRKALLLLPDEQRQVVVLRFLEEQTHDEVATTLGKSAEATRAIQYRALTSLRRMLIVTEEV